MDLATDPELRAALQVARSWGVSPSTFLGRATATVHFYDDAGRLVRSEAAGWTDYDRAAALALADYEADLCSGCRRPMAETTHEDAEFAYETSPAVRCHRCTASGQASDAYRDSPQPQALSIPLIDRRQTPREET